MKEFKGLRPAAMRCHVCCQTWLVAGARRGETYLCKRCGTRLLSDAPHPVPNSRPAAKPRVEARGGA